METQQIQQHSEEQHPKEDFSPPQAPQEVTQVETDEKKVEEIQLQEGEQPLNLEDVENLPDQEDPFHEAITYDVRLFLVS